MRPSAADCIYRFPAHFTVLVLKHRGRIRGGAGSVLGGWLRDSSAHSSPISIDDDTVRQCWRGRCCKPPQHRPPSVWSIFAGFGHCRRLNIKCLWDAAETSGNRPSMAFPPSSLSRAHSCGYAQPSTRYACSLGLSPQAKRRDVRPHVKKLSGRIEN